MASDAVMKDKVRNAYSGRVWQMKVDRMRPDQIAAIYLRLKAQGKIR